MKNPSRPTSDNRYVTQDATLSLLLIERRWGLDESQALALVKDGAPR
jgi:hypothetical protein